MLNSDRNKEEGRLTIRCKVPITHVQLIKALRSVRNTRSRGQHWASTYCRSDKQYKYTLSKNIMTVEAVRSN